MKMPPQKAVQKVIDSAYSFGMPTPGSRFTNPDRLSSTTLRLVTEAWERGIPSAVTKLAQRGRLPPQSQPLHFMDITTAEIPLVVDHWKLETPTGPLMASRVILTAGGSSYPKTGTTGDAYTWLTALGHTVLPLRPSLVPWTVSLPWVRDLAGLTLEDARVTLDFADKPSQRGGFLFTHQGVSGPAPMNLSRLLPREKRGPCRLLLDPFPDLDGKVLLEAIRAWRLPLPSRLAVVLKPEGNPAQWTKDQLQATARRLKAIPLQPAEPMGYDKAEVTQGGVLLAEVDPKTMASRIAPGLFVAGELLDLDGPIGGYNLAAAWATGWAAGKAAAS